jgi:hypothetical protein
LLCASLARYPLTPWPHARAAALDARAALLRTSRYTLRLGSNTSLEPAVVMGAAGMFANGTPAVRVKLLATNADVIVNEVSMLSKLGESFAPGDAIKRAMLSGDEEDATVRARRARAAYPRVPADACDA